MQPSSLYSKLVIISQQYSQPNFGLSTAHICCTIGSWMLNSRSCRTRDQVNNLSDYCKAGGLQDVSSSSCWVSVQSFVRQTTSASLACCDVRCSSCLYGSRSDG